MAGIRDDSSAQWIILSGFAISMSLIALAVLINQTSVTGYYSANAALEFPKEQIRDITSQTRETSIDAARIAWELNHTSNETVLQNFTRILNNYNNQVSILYAAHGETVNINISKVIFAPTSYIDTIWLNISYNDGKTYYASEPEIIKVTQ